MTYYERIQRSIDFIEENLGTDIIAEEAAGQAFLSIAHFYRLFPEFTGYSFKEYVRKRRLSESLEKIAYSDESLVDIAYDTGFNTHESFTRAFFREFGINPSELRKQTSLYGGIEDKGLEPITLINEFYDRVVIKHIEETYAICNRTISDHPERDAWKPLEKWARTEQKLKKPYRIFGLENPPPPKAERMDDEGNRYFTPVPGVAYGYEFRLTVSKNVLPSKGLVRKIIPEGRYAVISAQSDDYTIEWKGQAWAKMMRVLKTLCYRIKQYDTGPNMFEEHVLHFPQDDITRLDLYIELES